MPRPRCIRGDGIHYHVVLRCNNGEFLLGGEEDFSRFLDLLELDQKRLLFKLYNYTLLHSHVHMILSTHGDHYIDEVMHDFCLRYSKDYNERHGRKGHLWRNRYWYKPILTDLHALACLRYQHRNPDKAGIVLRPGQWRWCGYRFYTAGEESRLLVPHPVYMGLASNAVDRQRIYQSFTERPLSDAEWHLFEKQRRVNSKKFQKAIVKLTLPHLHEAYVSFR